MRSTRDSLRWLSNWVNISAFSSFNGVPSGMSSAFAENGHSLAVGWRRSRRCRLRRAAESCRWPVCLLLGYRWLGLSGRPDAPMKRWKLAISGSLIAAIAVPALSGVWRLGPGRWVGLTASQKQGISNYLEQTNNCRSLKPEEIDEAACRILIEQLGMAGFGIRRSETRESS